MDREALGSTGISYLALVCQVEGRSEIACSGQVIVLPCQMLEFANIGRYVVLNYVNVCLQHPIIEDTHPTRRRPWCFYHNLSILGKENWHTKDMLKFNGQSFHQQHHLAMHAKQ